jgi:hypothetical protein
MRWLSLLFLCACVGPQRVVTLRPEEAAEVARQYHDRVIVIGLVHDGGRTGELSGVLIEDGKYVVTRYGVFDLAPDDRVSLRIDYVDGDRQYDGSSIVRKGISPDKTGAGIGLFTLGALGLTATLIGGAGCGDDPPSSWNIGPTEAAFCKLGWGVLGAIAIATSAVGVGFFVRGVVPTNLTLVPNASAHGGGLSAALSF